MEDGKLQRNKEDIGNINNAAGWDLELEANGSNEFIILIGAAFSRSLLYERMHELSKMSLEYIFEKTREYWVMRLSKKKCSKCQGSKDKRTCVGNCSAPTTDLFSCFTFFKTTNMDHLWLLLSLTQILKNAEDMAFARTEIPLRLCSHSSTQALGLSGVL